MDSSECERITRVFFGAPLGTRAVSLLGNNVNQQDEQTNSPPITARATANAILRRRYVALSSASASRTLPRDLEPRWTDGRRLVKAVSSVWRGRVAPHALFAASFLRMIAPFLRVSFSPSRAHSGKLLNQIRRSLDNRGPRVGGGGSCGEKKRRKSRITVR